MESILPAKRTAQPAIWTLAGVTVAVNSCDECGGDQVCRACGGERFRKGADFGTSGKLSRCEACSAIGKCGACRGHCAVLGRFFSELENGEFGPAEACVQRELICTAKDDQSARTSMGIGAAGIGMFLGTIVAPGLGTIVGMSMGRMLGDKAAEGNEDPGKVKWRQADMLYCLGVVYAAQGRKGEASQAWIKAMTLNEKHGAARSALKETL